jgi:hypothetical protein
MTALASFKSEIIAITVRAAACSVSTFDYAVRVEPLVQRERIAQHAPLLTATGFSSPISFSHSLRSQELSAIHRAR